MIFAKWHGNIETFLYSDRICKSWISIVFYHLLLVPILENEADVLKVHIKLDEGRLSRNNTKVWYQSVKKSPWFISVSVSKHACFREPPQGVSNHASYCPASRTTLVATRFRVAVICPIIQVPHCIRVFFYFVWFVFINHIFQFYYELCTYCNILDIYLS